MSWIAEYDTQGREFPTCVHVTKTTGTMTHGVTYVPIEDGKAVRAENAKLRELAVGMYGMLEMFDTLLGNHDACETPRPLVFGEDKSFKDAMRELGIEVDG